MAQVSLSTNTRLHAEKPLNHPRVVFCSSTLHRTTCRATTAHLAKNTTNATHSYGLRQPVAVPLPLPLRSAAAGLVCEAVSSGGYASPTSSAPGVRPPPPRGQTRVSHAVGHSRSDGVRQAVSVAVSRDGRTDGTSTAGSRSRRAFARGGGRCRSPPKGGGDRNALPPSLVSLSHARARSPLSHSARTHCTPPGTPHTSRLLCRHVFFCFFCFFCLTCARLWPIVTACTSNSSSPPLFSPSTSSPCAPMRYSLRLWCLPLWQLQQSPFSFPQHLPFVASNPNPTKKAHYEKAHYYTNRILCPSRSGSNY